MFDGRSEDARCGFGVQRRMEPAIDKQKQAGQVKHLVFTRQRRADLHIDFIKMGDTPRCQRTQNCFQTTTAAAIRPAEHDQTHPGAVREARVEIKFRQLDEVHLFNQRHHPRQRADLGLQPGAGLCGQLRTVGRVIDQAPGMGENLLVVIARQHHARRQRRR